MPAKTLVASVLLSLSLVLPVHADDAVRKALRAGVDSIDIAQAVETYNAPDRIKPLLREHLEILLGSEAVKAYLMDEMAANLRYLGSGPEADLEAMKTRARSLVAAIVQDRTTRGIKRLSVADQRAFYAMVVELLSEMTPADCAAVISMELPALENQKLELQALSKMPEAFVRNQLSLSRKALLAEIEETGMALPLTPSEREVADTAYTGRLLEMLENHHAAEDIFAAAGESPAATDYGRCALGILSIQSALEVEGIAGDWTIRLLSE